MLTLTLFPYQQEWKDMTSIQVTSQISQLIYPSVPTSFLNDKIRSYFIFIFGIASSLLNNSLITDYSNLYPSLCFFLQGQFQLHANHLSLYDIYLIEVLQMPHHFISDSHELEVVQHCLIFNILEFSLSALLV